MRVRIDVYPVGWLEAYKHKKLKYEFRRFRTKLKARDWNAIGNMFNGYLAEPTPYPFGLDRCGHGWTKARARRKLFSYADDCHVFLEEIKD